MSSEDDCPKCGAENCAIAHKDDPERCARVLREDQEGQEGRLSDQEGRLSDLEELVEGQQADLQDLEERVEKAEARILALIDALSRAGIDTGEP